MISFKKRCQLAEAMDDPSLGPKKLGTVFQDLNRTNLILGGQRISLQAVSGLLARFPKDSYSIIDMGCGDGDLLRRLARKFRKARIEASFLGIDNSTAALELAVAQSAEFSEIQYRKASILELDQHKHSCDILLCTLTLHHFTDGDIKVLLQNFTRMARLGVVINDLQRNRLAYYLFHVFSLIFIKTKIAKQDGLISIRRGFLRKELHWFSRAFPNFDHRIRWRWVFRYLWVMQAKAVPLHERN